MEKQQKKSSGINVGSASIVMVFAVLCLTIFSALTYMTALSEKRLTDKSSEAIKNFYFADTACENSLADIRKLAKNCNTAQELKNSLETANFALPDDFKTELIGDVLYMTYSKSIESRQALYVELSYGGKTVDVLCWQAADVSGWQFDDHLDIWTGGELPQ